MESYEYSTRVGADGSLDLHLELGPAQANREVKVVVQPVVKSPAEEMSQEQWQAFVKGIAGSISDPSFVRQEQGEYENRSEVFP